MTVVQLLVYDLSRGMAAQMSEAMLGRRIEGIWHTGVSVFQYEYFFGGGMQKVPLGIFSAQNNLQPVSVLDMGTTSKSQAELEAFLRTISSRFATYDLLNNNCNNFSDEVVSFLLGRGIPSHIIDLPRIALSSPNGAMLRPLLESFQSNVHRSGGGGLDPFSIDGMSNSSVNFSTSSSYTTSSTTTITSKPHIRAELEDRPIVSADKDAKLLAAMARKLSGLVTEGERPVSAEQKLQVCRAAERLATDTQSVPDDSNVLQVLLAFVSDHPGSQVAALFIARLLVLEESAYAASPPSPPPAGQLLHHLLFLIMQIDASECDSGGFVSLSALTLGVSVMVNALATEGGRRLLLGGAGSLSADDVVDAAMRALGHSKAEVRLMAGSFLYNVCLYLVEDADKGEEMPQGLVQVLCGVLAAVGGESHDGVRIRMLSAVCLIVRACGSVASGLVDELGFAAELDALLRRGPVDKERTILEELLAAVRVSL